MKLILNNEEKIVELNSLSSADEVIEEINNLVNNRSLLSHLVIDGKDIYDDLEQYLDRYLGTINTVQIIAKSKQEFINDTLHSAEEYLNQAIIPLEDLGYKFYSNPTNEEWNGFAEFTEGLQWLIQLITKIDSFEEKPSNWIEYIDSYNKIQEQVEILNEGIENDDTTLMADVILYEFKPTYEKLKSIITYTIDIEGSRKDAN